MLPYITIPPLRIPLPFGWEPLELHAFGALVLIAIVLGARVTLKRGQERGIDPEIMHSAIFWLLVGGFVGAHFVHVVFYYPEMIKENPLSILMIWAGISSFGGFAGAIVGLFLFTWRYRFSFGHFSDPVALGLLPGWVFGRLGCTLAHDHPGKPTNFVLGIKYPDVSEQFTARHDLGFYEFLFTIGLVIAFHFIRKRTWRNGQITLLVGLIYAPFRFLTDFLRINDATYAGLTPAQIGCIAVVIGATYGLLRKPREPQVEPPPPDGEPEGA